MIDRTKIALLHVAKRDLALDDESYRALLKAEAGVDSARDLDAGGFAKVMKRLERAGFVSTAKSRSRARRVHQPAGLITPDQQVMIVELYQQLGWTDQSRQMGFSKRCCRKSFPQTRSDGIKVIEGLKAILLRMKHAQ
jgi:hypothetical protein